MKRIIVLSVLFLTFGLVYSQDSINVTFRYTALSTVERVYLPGEFNNWGPNSSGRIAVSAPSLMTLEDSTWYKTVKLKIGGGSTVINSEHVYQYKIHEHLNSDGSSYNWLPDPLNPNMYGQDNNSYLAIIHPLIFQIEPVALEILRNNQPAITATVAAINNDSIDVNQSEIFVNDTLAGAFGNYYDTAKQLLKIPSLSVFNTTLNSGLNEIKIVAVAKSGESRADSVNVNYIINPPIVNESVPEGIEDGINYDADPTKATLSLFAPYKRFVYIIGDFNNWTIDAAYFMKRDSTAPDSIRWWLTLSGLAPQQEYGFQYFIDDDIRIADPYTVKTLDPGNDSYNSIPYPEGNTDDAVSVLQTGQGEYQWQVTDFQAPPQEDLVIYELLIRDFVETHDYKTLIDTLDYFGRLGINAIELMPINEFEGNSSWGYNPAFYFAPDKYYGPPEDLKEFVDACHALGIAVIIDMVLNHSYGQSPFVRLYNEGQYGKPTPENPWYNVESPNPVYSWGYDFNHESLATKILVDRINAFWLNKFKVDGFRFDFTKGFTNKPGDGGAYDDSRIAILKRMADQIWEVNPQAYVILEHFSDNSEEKILAEYGMMIWGNSNYNYNEATMGYHDGSKSDFSWGYYGNRGWGQPNLVTYMESHDEERLMYKNIQHGNSSGDYNIKDLSTALQRIKMAGTFFFTYPGPKMIWQFGELGYDISIDDPCRVCEKPILWDYYQEYERNRLYRTFAALIKLRNENEVFRNAETVDMDVQKETKRIRMMHDSMDVVIMGNFDVISRSKTANFYHQGFWYDFFSGDSFRVSKLDTSITLAAGEFHIYTDKKTFTPDADLITALEEKKPQVVKEFRLDQNYPNPFNPQTVISYQLSAISKVELSVYNVLGQRIRTLINGKQQAGNYKVVFDGHNLASGLYIYRIKAGNPSAGSGQSYIQTRKMILLR